MKIGGFVSPVFLLLFKFMERLLIIDKASSFWHAEAGKGTVTIRDLEKAAITHDFAWTDKELVDMIRCFDSDGDGRVSIINYFFNDFVLRT